MDVSLSMFDKEELMALALLDMNRERYEEALAKLKQLLADPETPVRTHSLLGRVYSLLGLHDRAIQALETFLQLRPEVVPEHFHLGMLYRESGDGERAMEIWAEVLAKAPDFPPVLYHKALYLLEQGQRQDALEQLNQILETADPADEHIGLANTLMSEISLQS